MGLAGVSCVYGRGDEATAPTGHGGPETTAVAT